MSDDEETTLDEGDIPRSSSYMHAVKQDPSGQAKRRTSAPDNSFELPQPEYTPDDLRQIAKLSNQGTIEAQYFSQLKKARDLNVRLEAERAKIVKLQKRLAEIEKERLENELFEKRGVLLPSQKLQKPEASETEKNLHTLRDQVSRQQKLIESLRQENATLKREVANMKKVVAIEVGEESISPAMEEVDKHSPTRSRLETESLLNADITSVGGSKWGAPSTGWRGRAQQIAFLKMKIKELERFRDCSSASVAPTQADPGATTDASTVVETATVGTMDTAQQSAPSVVSKRTVRTCGFSTTTSTTMKDFDDVNRVGIEQREMNRRKEMREMQVVIANKDLDLEKEKKKNESLTARIQVLERDTQHAKMCLARVMEKTANDDKLISRLQKELETKGSASAVGAAGGRRVSQSDDQQRQILRLEDVVSELRRELVKARQESREASQSGLLQHREDPSVDPDSAMGRAQSVIDLQRDAILSLEAQLERRENATTALATNAADLPTVLREENASLKSRIKMLTEVMQKEIHLYKSLHSKPPASAGGQPAPSSKQVAHGRRRNIEEQGQSVDHDSAVPPRDAASAPTTGEEEDNFEELNQPPNLAMQEELEKLKRQYSELRRAYNAQQLSKTRLKTPPAGAVY